MEKQRKISSIEGHIEYYKQKSEQSGSVVKSQFYAEEVIIFNDLLTLVQREPTLTLEDINLALAANMDIEFCDDHAEEVMKVLTKKLAEKGNE